MRRFHLNRLVPSPEANYEDQEMIVASGVVFEDGTTVIRWRSDNPSTVVWDRYEDFEAVSVTNHPNQGHVWWLDE